MAAIFAGNLYFRMRAVFLGREIVEEAAPRKIAEPGTGDFAYSLIIGTSGESMQYGLSDQSLLGLVIGYWLGPTGKLGVRLVFVNLAEDATALQVVLNIVSRPVIPPARDGNGRVVLREVSVHDETARRMKISEQARVPSYAKKFAAVLVLARVGIQPDAPIDVPVGGDSRARTIAVPGNHVGLAACQSNLGLRLPNPCV